jgi:conjugative transfer region lipoprotein (TIGR03751 family)
MASTNDRKIHRIANVMQPSTRTVGIYLFALIVSVAIAGCAASVSGSSPLLEATSGSPTLLEIYRGNSKGVALSTSGQKTPRELMQSRPASEPPADNSSVGHVTNAGPVYVDNRTQTPVAMVVKPITAQIATGQGPGDLSTAGSPYWEAVAPMQQRFARVPNPDLVMVVFPHMDKQNYPIPGYVTVFPMYEQTVYALPGEVQEDR